MWLKETYHRWIGGSLRSCRYPRRLLKRTRTQLSVEGLEERVTPSVTVTTTLDPATPIAGQLSLREAINMVNAGQVADDTIILPAGTYQNMQGALNVTHSLILQGAGDINTILDGGGTDRVVLIDPTASVNVQISGVTIRDGNTTGGGGGIAVQEVGSQPSVLTVQNCIITGNRAADGGAISDDGSGTVGLIGSTLGNNAATSMGGGLFLGNPFLTATLQDSTVSGNTAGAFGGGIEDQAQSLTATNTILSNNVIVNGHGGGIDATNILNPTVTLTNVALVGNNAGGSGGQGGALFDGAVGGNDTLVSCLLADNTAAVNGGGLQQDQGTLSVRDSQLTGNSSGSSGGGLAALGGVSLLVSDTTFNDNQTGASGGALSFTANSSVASLTNDTFTGNTAIADGGALALFAQGATLTLVNDTINANTAGGNGGGVSIEIAASTYSFQNTIVAGNSAGGGGSDVFTATGLTVTDNGGNFLGTLSGSSGFAAGTLTGNPLLGPLQNNGGIVAGATGDEQVVQTEALLPGSPAIAKGVANGAPTTDERGFLRLTPPDIGAFQLQNVPLTVTVTTATPTVLVNSMETFTITVANSGDNTLPADNSTLTITLTAGLTTASPQTFTLSALPAGQSQTFTVTATATTLGSQMLTADLTSPDGNPNSVSGNATVNVVVTPPTLPLPPTTPHTPIGSLTLFAFGFGPTGIDLFEVDSAGDIFAVPFMGGGTPLFLNTSLHLPIAVLANGQLLALLAASNGQDDLIDIVNPFNTFIEPAVFAALTHG
ncbi:MAG TPA: choice-of-anchor Q domain-containing protein [Gemmataceae bacterium]|nr:choice-of-anchor Q domain-containing protein [Gemmataceae bacterium]